MDVSQLSYERFIEAKEKVTRKYNDAKTMIDGRGQYYISSGGRDVCNLTIGNTIDDYSFGQTYECDTDCEMDKFSSAINNVPHIPHSNSVKEAWIKAEVAIKSVHVVERNSSKFSNEKAMKQAIKDFE
jgi:hypothetical protein|tara:strand:+ start:302 stop:685 length:384 start_codon:yes stop_codon:yes gene_type:complete